MSREHTKRVDPATAVVWAVVGMYLWICAFGGPLVLILMAVGLFSSTVAGKIWTEPYVSLPYSRAVVSAIVACFSVLGLVYFFNGREKRHKPGVMWRFVAVYGCLGLVVAWAMFSYQSLAYEKILTDMRIVDVWITGVDGDTGEPLDIHCRLEPAPDGYGNAAALLGGPAYKRVRFARDPGGHDGPGVHLRAIAAWPVRAIVSSEGYQAATVQLPFVRSGLPVGGPGQLTVELSRSANDSQ